MEKNSVIYSMKKIIKYFLKALVFIILFPIHLFNFIRGPFWYTLTFGFLITAYFLAQLGVLAEKFIPFRIGKLISVPTEWLYNLVIKLERTKSETISRGVLIKLAIRNMAFKKSRTIVTISGMAVGIGAIVFLVSIGYGLEEMIISRVARLEEMRQIEVSAQPGGKIKINDDTISTLDEISGTMKVLPLISMVGRINFQGSASDMAAYGVTSDYLEHSAIQPIRGKIFESRGLFTEISDGDIKDNRGEEISWIPVRDAPKNEGMIVGYTKKDFVRKEIEKIGSVATSSENNFESGEKQSTEETWFSVAAPVWSSEECRLDEEGCDNGGRFLLVDENGNQRSPKGFVRMASNFSENKSEIVMGEEIEFGQEKTDGGLEWVDLDIDGIGTSKSQIKQIEVSASALRESVVNIAMLRIMGISEDEAVGREFSVSFVNTSQTGEGDSSRIESVPVNYTISGVILGDKTPMIYVPFSDLRSLGVNQFSQVKIVADSEDVIPEIRSHIEAMGYSTSSVVDTVDQINNFFVTARMFLALLGMIALGVAALGMFNTLTVSLLERTREVGLLKAMGMRGMEVRDLLLTESMVMGVFGGLLGIVFGYLAGKLVGMILSVLTIVKGAGVISITHIPISFMLVIVILSMAVGMITGIYPARRSKNISALNALRYE